MSVIEAVALRKEFTVRVRAGWLRRKTRIVAAVDGIDLSVERGTPAEQAACLAVQAGWVVTILAVCRWVQRQGERKLVVQGG